MTVEISNHLVYKFQYGDGRGQVPTRVGGCDALIKKSLIRRASFAHPFSAFL